MHILIDAMGGDKAPGEIVRGAVEASREFHVDVALVGREAEILACLNEMDDARRTYSGRERAGRYFHGG